MQWVTDVHKPVIGHQGKKQTIHTRKKDKNRHLCQAASIGDDSAVRLDVHNHLGNSGGDETYVNRGQVGEEVVHGGVEAGVRGDG